MPGVLDSLGVIDADILSVGTASGAAAVTGGEMAAFKHIIAKGVPSGGAPLGLAMAAWSGSISNDLASSGSLSVTRGATVYVLAPGAEAAFELDGTANGLNKTKDLGGNSSVMPTIDLSNVKRPIRSISLADGNQSVAPSVLTSTETTKRRSLIRLTGADASDGSGNTLNLPAVNWIGIIANEAANTVPINIVRGVTTETLAVGEAKFFLLDGSENGLSAQPIPGSTAAPVWHVVTHADSPFQAVSGGRYAVDTTGGAVTIELPADPNEFDQVDFRDRAGTFETHALTIDGNGNTITADTARTASTNGMEFGLIFGLSEWGIA